MTYEERIKLSCEYVIANKYKYPDLDDKVLELVALIANDSSYLEAMLKTICGICQSEPTVGAFFIEKLLRLR